MANWKKAEREPGRYLKELSVDEVYDHLDSIRRTLAGSLGRKTSREWNRARDLMADTAGDAEETMKENLAVSLILAIGIGVLIGYLMARKAE